MPSETSETRYGVLLPLSAAAARMGVSVWHLRDLCRKGAIASIKIGSKRGQRGGRRLIPESEIDAWIGRNLRAE